MLHLCTKDNIPVSVDGFLHARVIDPIKASYQAERPYDQLIECTGTQLRPTIGQMNYDDLLNSLQQLNKETQAVLDPIAKSYGISVIRFSIRDVVVPDRISRAQTAEMEAQHEKHARIVKSESRTLEKLDDAKTEAEIEALMIAKRARATAEGMEVMGLEPGRAQPNGECSSPIAAAAHFLDEFSKPRKSPESLTKDVDARDSTEDHTDTTEDHTEAEDLLADNHFQPKPLPTDSKQSDTDDHFQPEPLPGAVPSFVDSQNNFQPQPLPDRTQSHADDHFQPQPLPSAEQPADESARTRRFVFPHLLVCNDCST